MILEENEGIITITARYTQKIGFILTKTVSFTEGGFEELQKIIVFLKETLKILEEETKP